MQRELWVKLIHDTNIERGSFSVVTSSFIFTNPPEDERKKNKKNRFHSQEARATAVEHADHTAPALKHELQ